MRPIHRGNAERWKAGLELKCCWYDQDALELGVTASNAKFSGLAHPYVSLDYLAEAAEILDRFPKDTSDTRELSFGTPGEKFAGGFVHLKFSCRDLSGHAVIEVEIESKNESRRESLWNQFPQASHFFAEIEANAVDEFVKELRQLNQNKNGTAWLPFASS